MFLSKLRSNIKYLDHVANSSVNQVSLSFLIISLQQKALMETQTHILSNYKEWITQTNQLGTICTKINFLRFNQDFQFRETLIYNQKKLLLVANGQLIFNNGLTVPISSGYQLLFTKVLNRDINLSKSKVVFSIDQGPQTLVFTAKVLGISDDRLMEAWIKEFEHQVMNKRQTIVSLLAVTGMEMDSQSRISMHLLKCKRNLKSQLQEILQHPFYSTEQIMVPEHCQESVIRYGPGTNYTIEEQKSSIQQGKSQNSKNKRVEGGYFTIEYSNFTIQNQLTSTSERKMLCRKTLRAKRQSQDYAHEQNRKKMKKQLLIVDSIKDKRFLLKYYYRGNIDQVQEVLMEKYDYSLQEYIYYYGDCLEVQNKIIIAKQIVEAVLTLHRSGVVHRDIKPSNILIEDHMDYTIKLIDFAESYSGRINFQVGDYGCSCPYSPLECAEKKYTCPEGNREGIVRQQIDYWSVGMTLYELFFRKLPVSFSRAFMSDITLSWKNELLLAVNQRPKSGLGVVDDVITVICIRMIKFDQQKRMNLTVALRILNLLEYYVKSVLSLVDDK